MARKTLRDADEVRRSNIPTIRDVKVRKNLVKETASVIYYNMSGASSLNIGKDWEGSISSMQIVNSSGSEDAIVSLHLNRSVEPSEIFLFRQVRIPIGASLMLEGDEVKVDESGTVYVVSLTDGELSGSAPEVSIIINL